MTKYPQRRRRRALRQQGLRPPVRDVHGRLRGHVLGHRRRRHARARVRRRLPRRVRLGPDRRRRRSLHRRRRADQLRGIGESVQAQHRADARSSSAGCCSSSSSAWPRWPTAPGDAGRAFEFKDGEARRRRDGRRRRRWPSTRSSASRTPSTSPRRPATRSATTRARCSAGLLIAGRIYLAGGAAGVHGRARRRARRLDGPAAGGRRLGPLAVSTKVFAAIALFAVANGALINMIMASRLTYGMAAQGIVPRVRARARRPPDAAGRDRRSRPRWRRSLVRPATSRDLADTTVLLLLVVFVVVNVASSCCAATASTTTTSTRRRSSRSSGIAVCSRSSRRRARDVRAGRLLLALGVVFWLVNRLLTGPRGPFDTRELEVVEAAEVAAEHGRSAEGAGRDGTIATQLFASGPTRSAWTWRGEQRLQLPPAQQRDVLPRARRAEAPVAGGAARPAASGRTAAARAARPGTRRPASGRTSRARPARSSAAKPRGARAGRARSRSSSRRGRSRRRRRAGPRRRRPARTARGSRGGRRGRRR